MLLNGGELDGQRILSPETVPARLPEHQMATRRTYSTRHLSSKLISTFRKAVRKA
jgi:hypothetical protein